MAGGSRPPRLHGRHDPSHPSASRTPEERPAMNFGSPPRAVSGAGRLHGLHASCRHSEWEILLYGDVRAADDPLGILSHGQPACWRVYGPHESARRLGHARAPVAAQRRQLSVVRFARRRMHDKSLGVRIHPSLSTSSKSRYLLRSGVIAIMVGTFASHN